MSKNHALLGIGSNLEQPQAQVRKAISRLARDTQLELLGSSSIYTSSPQGPQDQDDYVNAVIHVSSDLNPFQLLTLTQAIEHEFGRVKTRHWGERIIDLDILFFNQEHVHSEQPDLCIPHPYALERDFVLYPACELVPEWQLPDGSCLKDHLANCVSHNLRRIDATDEAS